MIKRINVWEFEEAFYNMGRGESFSIYGLHTLFGYLEELDEDYELDVVELCCTYTEYATIADFNDAYGTDYEDYNEISETFVIPVDDTSFIIHDF